MPDTLRGGYDIFLSTLTRPGLGVRTGTGDTELELDRAQPVIDCVQQAQDRIGQLNAPPARRRGIATIFRVLLDLLDHPRAKLFQVDADPAEYLPGHAVILADQREQQVPGIDVLVVKLQGLPQRELQALLGPRRETPRSSAATKQSYISAPYLVTVKGSPVSNRQSAEQPEAQQSKASNPRRQGVPELDRDTARDWIERWDRQQEESLPDREDRFTALIDAVEAGTGRSDPLVLDIGCGPGSLAVRLLARLPQATVIGIDADPVSLTLGRAAYQDVPGLRFADLDLRFPGWSVQLGLGPGSRAPDAAVSTTALHWLPEPDLRALYAELASVLRPGGLLLDGDHFTLDAKESPTLARLDLALRQREDQRRFPGGHLESWHAWWEAAAADPALAGHIAERRRRRLDAGHHGDTQSTQLATHVEALKAVGFAEVGTLWQRGDNRLLCGVLPPG